MMLEENIEMKRQL